MMVAFFSCSLSPPEESRKIPLDFSISLFTYTNTERTREIAGNWGGGVVNARRVQNADFFCTKYKICIHFTFLIVRINSNCVLSENTV